MDIEGFERNAPTEDVAVALHRDGAAVVRDQVPGDAVDAVLAELRPCFDKEGRLTESDCNGVRTLRIGGILARSRTSAELIGQSRAMEVADARLLPHCIGYQIGSTTAIEILPGESEQLLHADDVIYPMRVPGLQLQFSAMWPLVDFTLESSLHSPTVTCADASFSWEDDDATKIRDLYRRAPSFSCVNAFSLIPLPPVMALAAASCERSLV